MKIIVNAFSLYWLYHKGITGFKKVVLNKFRNS